MYTVRYFLGIALVFLALSLPSVAQSPCTVDADCTAPLVGTGATCHNSACYYESCDFLLFDTSSDCYTTKFFGLTVNHCRCTNRKTHSNYKRKRDLDTCPPQHERCPVLHGRGGWECVNTQEDIEACGGCPGVDGDSQGVDCTQIAGAESVSCSNGACVIDECSRGYRLDHKHTTCTPIAGMRIQKNPLKRNWRMD